MWVDPGHALESQVKKRNPPLHAVKKTHLQAKPRMSTSHPSSGSVPPAILGRVFVQRPLLSIQRPFPEFFSSALFVFATYVATIVFLQPVKTPFEFVKSCGKAAPCSARQS